MISLRRSNTSLATKLRKNSTTIADLEQIIHERKDKHSKLLFIYLSGTIMQNMFELFFVENIISNSSSFPLPLDNH